ncbi:hypothetical protein K3495_g11551 [Podosphaera aphanis]|nr:hypothetical protein K3495_g11551 [Podosphaera aphanis]
MSAYALTPSAANFAAQQSTLRRITALVVLTHIPALRAVSTVMDPMQQMPQSVPRPRRNVNRITKEQMAQIRQYFAAARISLSTIICCTRRSPRNPSVDHEKPDATSMPNFGTANPSSQTSLCTDVVPSGSSRLTVISATYSPVHTGNPHSLLDETNEI